MCVCFFVLTKGTWDPAIAKNLIVGGVIPQNNSANAPSTMLKQDLNHVSHEGELLPSAWKNHHGD